MKGFIYLIRQDNFLKIGFTTNVKKRMKQYETHNAKFDLLYYYEGESFFETLLHKNWKKYKYKTEWFYYNNEIIDFFKNFNIRIKELINKNKTYQKFKYFNLNEILLIKEKFVDDVLSLQGNEIKFLFLLCEYSVYTPDIYKNAIFSNSIYLKKFINKNGFCMNNNTINVYISNIAKKGFIIKLGKGCYMLNPKYFFKI